MIEDASLDSYSLCSLYHCRVSVKYFFPIFNKTLLKSPNPWVWIMFPKYRKKSLWLIVSDKKTLKLSSLLTDCGWFCMSFLYQNYPKSMELPVAVCPWPCMIAWSFKDKLGIRGRVVKVVNLKKTTCLSHLWIRILPRTLVDSFMWESYLSCLWNVVGPT